ncbi:hypothetical protein ABPG75_006059 [Micractinium tetrahymenae]
MDPALLARLPDAAKLGILRHLGAGRTSSSTPALSPQQPADTVAQPPGASPSPAAAAPQHEQQAEAANAAAGSSAPALVQRRRLEGGLAVLDGFLDTDEVEAARDEARSVLAERSRAAGMVAAPAAGSTKGAGGVGTGGSPGSAAEPRTWSSAATRGDRAAWLSPADLQASGHRRLAGAVQSLLALRPWLQGQGYDVGGRPSVQLACYPGGGARYVRHRDASASVPYRSVTAILYLNSAWEASHGGSLCVYNHSTVGSDPCAASASDLRLSSASGAGSDSSSGPNGMGLAQRAAVAASGQLQQEQAAQRGQQQQGQQQQGGVPPAISSGLDEGHCATVVPPLGGRLVVMDSRLLHEVLPAQAERYALTVWFSKTPPPQRQVQQGSELQQAKQEQPPLLDGQPQGQQLQGHEAEQQQRQQRQQWRQRRQQQQKQASALVLDAAPITAPGCVFVSIPAYRDSEAQWTMADLFAKAAHPERVRVGIVWQVELPGDAEFMRLAGDQRWLAQVRQVVLPAGEATGPCKARALAQQLWEGEEFHLQIDSHMRFAPEWDAALLRMLRQAEAAAGHPRVVLSTYPPGYEGEGPAAALPPDSLPTVLCASQFGEPDGLLRIRGRKLREPLAAPAPALFWAAGFSFSRAQLIQEVPYPRSLPGLFFGEELLQLQRMWCAGWDVYTPPTAVAFHLWSRKHRPTFQDERQADCAEQQQHSQARVAAVLAGEEEDADGCRGSQSGGRGQGWQRSLQQFWEHTGVDFRHGNRAVSARAHNGGWPAEAFLTCDP